MTGSSPERERLRQVLEEMAAGRILVDEAMAEVDRLRPTGASMPRVALASTSRGRLMSAPSMVLIFAAMITAVGGYFGWRTMRFEIFGRTTEGRVIRMAHGGGAGNHTKPVIAYSVDGREYTVTGIVSSSPPAWNVGQKAVVHYNPADPSDAQVSGFIERWLFPSLFGTIGIVIGAIGLALRRVFRENSPVG